MAAPLNLSKDHEPDGELIVLPATDTGATFIRLFPIARKN
jgi:hypothetical protein